MKTHEEKIAVVTGAASGFGKEVSIGLANDVAPFGITVNAISPTLSQTKGADEQLAHIIPYDAVAQLQAIKEVGQAKDIVPTILFLTSEDARFITGQNYAVDGGLARY